MVVDDLVQRNVASVSPGCTLREAARQMTMHSVGAVVVAETRTAPPVGIVTDRDIVTQIACGVDPGEITVGDIAKQPLRTVVEGASLVEVTTAMRRYGVRRLPVVDKAGALTGIVALDDVLGFLARELGDLAQVLAVEVAHEHPVPSAHERSR